jgi:sigma-B regulation protein RsbU (phosphoserine phosphatase)
MADVSGKGVPAALVVAAMRATLYTLAKRELALRSVFRYANEFINTSTRVRAKYVTLFYAVLDVQARRMIYVNAGHLPPVVLRASGDVDLLRSGGFPLGFFDAPRYFEQFAQLSTGDLVCLYTDGITETSNAKDEDYGRSRLIEALKRHRQKTAAEIADALLSDVRRFEARARSTTPPSSSSRRLESGRKRDSAFSPSSPRDALAHVVGGTYSDSWMIRRGTPGSPVSPASA